MYIMWCASLATCDQATIAGARHGPVVNLVSTFYTLTLEDFLSRAVPPARAPHGGTTTVGVATVGPRAAPARIHRVPRRRPVRRRAPALQARASITPTPGADVALQTRDTRHIRSPGSVPVASPCGYPRGSTPPPLSDVLSRPRYANTPRPRLATQRLVTCSRGSSVARGRRDT